MQIVKLSTGVILIGVSLLLLGLFFAETLLVTRQTPRKADMIVVLGGENVSRTSKALQLYRQGFAPLVLVSGNKDGEIISQSLIASGVPRGAILIENSSKSTFENATFSQPILNNYRAKTVILVTSWFHSRRATAVFKAVSGSIHFISIPTATDSIEQLKSGNETTKFVLMEYLKIAGYWLRYGITPFEQAVF